MFFLFVSEQPKPSKEMSIGTPYSFTHNVHLEIGVNGEIKVCCILFTVNNAIIGFPKSIFDRFIKIYWVDYTVVISSKWTP